MGKNDDVIVLEYPNGTTRRVPLSELGREVEQLERYAAAFGHGTLLFAVRYVDDAPAKKTARAPQAAKRSGEKKLRRPNVNMGHLARARKAKGFDAKRYAKARGYPEQTIWNALRRLTEKKK